MAGEKMSYGVNGGFAKMFLSFLAVLMIAVLIPFNHVFAEDGEEDEEEETVEAVQSYAQILYDATEKNAAIPYYSGQTSGISVQQIVNEELGIDATANGTPGYDYALFLETMNEWNLYVTYRNVMDVGMGVFGTIGKLVIGGVAIIGLYLADILDTIMDLIVDLLGYMNIFSYMGTNAEGGFEIDPDNWLSFLQPVVDVFNGISGIAKVAIGLVLIWIIFMTVSGVGKARNRGSYFWKGFGKVFTMLFAIVGLPIMLSFLIQTFADELQSEEGMFGSLASDIPHEYIVDSQAWIDGSMSIAEEEEDALANGGQVLYKPTGDGYFPTSRGVMRASIPHPDLVEALNDPMYHAGLSDTRRPGAVNGTTLLADWMSMNGVTASSLDGMYGLTGSDDTGRWYNPFSWGDDDEARIAQFGLSPQSEFVQVADGSGLLSTDYEEVTIQRASMVGNGVISIALNGVEMVSKIWGIVIVSYVMMFSVLSAIFRSVVLFTTNIAIAALGSVAGVVGVIMTFVMLVTTVITAILTIGIFAQLVDSLPTAVYDSMGIAFDAGAGILGQVVRTIVTLAVNIGGIFIAIKTRRSVITAIEDFFKRILIRLNLSTHGDGQNTAGSAALQNMSDNVREGWSAPERMDNMLEPALEEARAMRAESGDASAAGMAAYEDALRNNPDDIGAAKGAYDKAFKDSKAANRAQKGGMRARMANAGLAGLSGGLKDIAENSPNSPEYDPKTGRGRSMTDASGFLANQANKGLMKAQGLNSSGDMDAALDERDERTSELEAAGNELKDAQDKVAKLKANRAKAANEGATQAELDEMDQNIADAERELELKGNRVRNAGDSLIASGGLQDEINQSEAQAIDALNEASTTHQDATEALGSLEEQRDELQAERDRMEANGASAESLREMDDRIQDVDDQIAEQEAIQRQAQREMDNARAMMDNGVVDANNVTNAAMDKNSAEEEVYRANEALENAKVNGELSEEDAKVLQREIEQNSGVLEGVEQDRQSAFSQAQSEKDAHDYIADNNGQVFNENDVSDARAAYDTASDEYANAISGLEQMESDRKAVSEQAGIVSDAKQELADKQTALSNLREDGASDIELAKAEQDIRNASEAVQAEQSKLNTLKDNAPTDEAIKAQEGKVEEAMMAQAEAGSMLNTVENIANGNMSSMSDSAREQEMSIQSAQEDMETAYGELDKAQTGMAELNNRLANGEEVSSKELEDAYRYVRAAENGVETASDAYNSAVSNRDDSIKQAQAELTESKDSVNKAQTELNDLKQSGASDSDIQMAEIKLDDAKAEHAAKEATVRSQQTISGGTQADMLESKATLDTANENLSELYAAKAAGKPGITQASIKAAEQDVADAKMDFKRASNMHNANVDSHLKGGSVSDSMVASQKERLNAFKDKEVQANERLSTLEGLKASGENIPESQIEQAQRTVKTARDNVASAQRVYEGMNAQNITGGVTDPDKRAAVNRNYQAAKKGLDNIQNMRSDLSTALASGTMSKGHMVQLMKSNQLMAQKAADKTQMISGNLEKAQDTLARKEKIQKNGGRVSSREIAADRDKVKRLTEELHTARKAESQIDSQAGLIKDKARTMNDNIKRREQNVEAATGKLEEMTRNYDRMMMTRGIDENTIEGARNKINADMDDFSASPPRFVEHYQKVTEGLVRERIDIEEKRADAKRMSNMTSVGRHRGNIRRTSDW